MNNGSAGSTLRTLVAMIVLAAGTMLGGNHSHAQGRLSCGPSPVGSTCGGSGPASLGNTSGTDQGAGNPINIITGNKYQRETDMAPLPGELGLELVRHYNSLDRSMGSMGVGWRLSYDTEVVAAHDTIQVLEADGSRIVFTRDPRRRSLCASLNPSNGTLKVEAGREGTAGYLWTWPNGRRLRFNAGGKLESITDSHGGLLTLARNLRGELISVTDPLGRTLRLHYSQPNPQNESVIAAIDSPIGRFAYSHLTKPGSSGYGTLASVTLSDQRTVRDYFYEPQFQSGNPHALTGIAVRFSDEPGSTQRLSTYAYQANGWAIWSMRGKGIETVAIAQGGQIAGQGETGATLINAQGEKTRYSFALVGGEHRLLEARGPACARCGESNVRHGYDSSGRLVLTEKLSDTGVALNRSQFSWDGSGRLQRVRRPSVIAGKFHDFDYIYPSAASKLSEPLARIERGFSPDGRIVRRVDFEYDGVGRILRAGGTRYLYDHSGRVIQKSEPGGRITGYQYDALSRPTRIMQADGKLIEYRYDTRGRISAISVNGRAEQYAYDAAERISQVTRPDGETLHYSYDAADHVEKVADANGNAIDFERDADGGLVSRRLLDAFGHLIQQRIDSVDGASNEPSRIALDPEQRPVGFTDGRGLRSGYSYDDFGRLTRAYSPDGGVTRYQYDREDRLVSKLLPSGIRIRFRYDVGGRLIERSTPDGATFIQYGTNQRPSTVRFPGGEERYTYDTQGHLTERVSRLGDHDYTSRYQYDSTGALTLKQLPGGQRLEFGYRRAPKRNVGTLESITLLDGRRRIALISALNDDLSNLSKRRFDLLGAGRYERELDVEGRVIRIGAAGLWEQDFSYVHGAEDGIDSSIKSAGSVESVAYRYDNRGRLVVVGSTGPTISTAGFAFDDGNNLIGIAGRQSAGFRTDSGSNRRLGSARYNINGSIAEESGRQFLWDADARLKGIIQDGRVVSTYAYNALGERIGKTVFDSGRAHSTRYIYERGKITAEIDERGRVIKQYIWLDDQPVAMIDGDRMLAIVADQTDAPRAIVDAQRRTVALNVTNLRGSNQYFDAESGLLYNGRRYLSPETGRYLSPDPLGLAGGSNPYVFAANDAIANIDLIGLQSVPALAQNPVIADWTVDQKLGFIFEQAANQIADHELSAALRELVSPAALATTTIIFSTWAASQFTPYGWVGDIALTGIGALFLGTSIWDVIQTTYRVAQGMATATCQSDLQDVSSVLARGLSQAAAALTAASATGAAVGSARIARLLRTVFTEDGNAVRRSSARAAINQSRFGVFNPSRGTYAGRIANREWMELQRANGRSDAHPPWDPARPVVDTWLNPGEKVYVIQDRIAGPGGWATTKQYRSLEDARNELSVLEEFKRSGSDLVLQEYVVTTVIPVRDGFAGPQVSGWPASETYVGGGRQVQFLVDLRGSTWETYLKPTATIELSK